MPTKNKGDMSKLLEQLRTADDIPSDVFTRGMDEAIRHRNTMTEEEFEKYKPLFVASNTLPEVAKALSNELYSRISIFDPIHIMRLVRVKDNGMPEYEEVMTLPAICCKIKTQNSQPDGNNINSAYIMHGDDKNPLSTLSDRVTGNFMKTVQNALSENKENREKWEKDVDSCQEKINSTKKHKKPKKVVVEDLDSDEDIDCLDDASSLTEEIRKEGLDNENDDMDDDNIEHDEIDSDDVDSFD